MNITIRQRENGKYQAIISYKNKKGKWKQKSKGGFTKRKDASLWANEMSFELKRLEKTGVLENSYTLQEVYDLFIETNAQELSVNSKRFYERAMSFFSEFGDYPVNEIKPTELLNFIKAKRLETGNQYNHYIEKIKTIFNFAMNNLRACDFNPCNLLYKDRKTIDTRTKFIDEKLYSLILNNLKGEKRKLLVRTLYETGMRIGEVYGICTQNVNNNLIVVNQKYDFVSNKISPKLKTKNSYRVVPISNELFLDLKRATVDIDGRIFHDVGIKSITNHLKKYNVSPHCFRHTRATILVSSGIDLTVIANIVGDKIETILRTYVDVNKNDIEDKYEQVRKLI